MERGHAFIAWILVGIAIGWFARKGGEEAGLWPADGHRNCARRLSGRWISYHPLRLRSREQTWPFHTSADCGLRRRDAVTPAFLVRMNGLAIHSSPQADLSICRPRARFPKTQKGHAVMAWPFRY